MIQFLYVCECEFYHCGMWSSHSSHQVYDSLINSEQARFLLLRSRCSSRWYWRESMLKEIIFLNRSLSCNCCSWYGWRFGGWNAVDEGACPGFEGGQELWSSVKTRMCPCLGQTAEEMSWALCPGHGNIHRMPWLEMHRSLRAVGDKKIFTFSGIYAVRSLHSTIYFTYYGSSRDCAPKKWILLL